MIYLVVLVVSLISASAFDWEHMRDFQSQFRAVNNHGVLLQNFQRTLDEMIPRLDNFTIESYSISVGSIIRAALTSNQTVAPPDVSEECMITGMKLILPITKIPSTTGKIIALLYLPIGKMIDAFGKLPERFLLGSNQFPGAADECRDLNNTKYCMTGIQVLGTIASTYGSCFPKECTPNDVNKVIQMLSTYTKGLISVPPNATLCDKPVEYSTGVITTVSIMMIVIALCLIGTLVDIIRELSASKLYPIKHLYDNDDYENEEDEKEVSGRIEYPDDEPVVSVVDSKKRASSKLNSNVISLRLPPSKVVEGKSHGSNITKFFVSFSLVKNTRMILSTKVSDGAITSINGIRVMSLTWVILGHMYLMTLANQPDNILTLLGKVVHRFTFLAVGNAYASVDTFFLLSGLLVSYLTLKRIAKRAFGMKEVAVMYLHRFIRLTPSLAITILFYTNIFPIIIPGPKGLYLSQTDVLRKPCYDTWWSTLFYFNNFYPTKSGGMCLGWTWYLSNDMQFYLFSPPLLLLMVHIEKAARTRTKAIIFNMILISGLCLSSMITTGVVTGVFDVDALNTAPFIANDPRAKNAADIMDKIYDKPYCRVGPYFIGIFLGYIFSRNVTFNPRKWTTKLNTIGWILSTVIGLAVVFGPWHVFKPNGYFFSDAENILYAACCRCAWAIAVAWVVWACHNQLGGLVNEILSWKMWIPLSRLTYGAYLVHFIVLMYFFWAQEIPIHYQDATMVFNFVSVAVISYACAFVLAVCVEFPTSNLEAMVFKR